MAAIGRQALTALLPVRAGREAALEARLVAAGPSLSGRLSSVLTLHFARLVVLPGTNGAGHSRARLLLETTYDGALGPHLEELYAAAGADVGALLAECDEVVPGDGVAAFEATLRRAARGPRAFAAARGELGVLEIQRDALLRERAIDLLERERARFGALRPLAILIAVRRELGLGASGGSSEPEPRVRGAREDAVPRLLALVRLVAGLLLHDVRERLHGLWHDRSDTPAVSANASALPMLASRAPQRAFTLVVPPRSGRFRHGALRQALALAGSALGGEIERRAAGVHSVRFVLLDDGRLLFTSQQDGSLASLLWALARHAKALAALVFSSTEGFPRGLLGHLAGRTDDERWLEWLRSREVTTGFFYSAYPTLTARDIAQNAELAGLLGAEPTEERARRFLALV